MARGHANLSTANKRYCQSAQRNPFLDDAKNMFRMKGENKIWSRAKKATSIKIDIKVLWGEGDQIHSVTMVNKLITK